MEIISFLSVEHPMYLAARTRYSNTDAQTLIIILQANNNLHARLNSKMSANTKCCRKIQKSDVILVCYMEG